jgi:hypothetical protein
MPKTFPQHVCASHGSEPAMDVDDSAGEPAVVVPTHSSTVTGTYSSIFTGTYLAPFSYRTPFVVRVNLPYLVTVPNL